MRYFGLIGAKLGHSFSKKYFSDKFQQAQIEAQYELYELASIEELPALWARVPLTGLNVTIPYKEQVIPFMDELSPAAQAVGAVNTILFREGKRYGHNSDVYGFRESLLQLLDGKTVSQALILGTGGAAKAVHYVLSQLGFQAIKFVSRSPKNPEQIAYAALAALDWTQWPLLINTTPLGMHPHVARAPELPYHLLTEAHYAFDLVYNPAQTLFMQKAAEYGAATQNGLAMLHLQAEGSWRFWNGK